MHLQTTIMYCGTEMKSEAAPPHVMGSPNFPYDPPVAILVAKLLQLHRSSTDASMVYPWAECVLILDHYSHQKLFSSVREGFSNVKPDTVVPNETIHQLVRKFWGTRKYLWWATCPPVNSLTGETLHQPDWCRDHWEDYIYCSSLDCIVNGSPLH
jgi:hypothetical protein